MHLPNCAYDTPYQLLVQSITDCAICMLDLDGNVSSWNAGAERAKGYHAAEIVGRPFSCFYSPQDQGAGIPFLNLDRARRTGRFEDQSWRYRRDGSRFWAHVVIDAIRHEGELVGFVKTTRDGTQQRHQQIALETMAANLRLALSCLPYGACLLDTDARVVLCNPAFATMFGLASPAASLGVALHDILREHDALENRTGDLALALGLGDRDGQEVSLDLEFGTSIVHVKLRPTDGGGTVATFEDVGEQRRSAARVLHRVRHDSLTGLANRDALHEHLDALLRPSSPSSTDQPGRCTVFLFDFDRFTAFTDTQGHLVADAVLVEAARRIKAAACSCDFIARLGEDQFLLMVEGDQNASRAMATCHEFRATLAKPYTIEGNIFELAVSAGIAFSLRGGSTSNELIGCAESALFKAKRGGEGLCIFDSDVGLAVLKRRTMELRLRQALSADQFTLAYQPIYSTEGHEVAGFEALIRWNRINGATVSPAEFVPVAEELGLMAEIGGWVLDTACREAASWPASLTLAVNVSATQMHDPRFLGRVAAALEASGLGPQRLELEITETAVITDLDLAMSVLGRLRDMGVRIAIDDFGTGYSSLSFLRTLPFTRVKIDRSFVCDIASNSQSMAIVRAVMSMSRELGLAVTAEGVETEEQRRILAREACGELQGYLFAKPMPREEIGLFLQGATQQPRYGTA